MTFSCHFTWAVRSRAPDVMGRSGGNGWGLAGAGCGTHRVRAVGIRPGSPCRGDPLVYSMGTGSMRWSWACLSLPRAFWSL